MCVCVSVCVAKNKLAYVNTVHPKMYTRSVPLFVCFLCVCVCCPFLGNKNIINGVQATASFVSITNSDKGKNMKALVKASHCKRWFEMASNLKHKVIAEVTQGHVVCPTSIDWVKSSPEIPLTPTWTSIYNLVINVKLSNEQQNRYLRHT